MTMLQLIPSNDAEVSGKNTVLPALRAGIDSSGTFAMADGRASRRRRAVARIRLSDMGLRPFRVY